MGTVTSVVVAVEKTRYCDFCNQSLGNGEPIFFWMHEHCYEEKRKIKIAKELISQIYLLLQKRRMRARIFTKHIKFIISQRRFCVLREKIEKVYARLIELLKFPKFSINFNYRNKKDLTIMVKKLAIIFRWEFPIEILGVT